MKQFVTKIVGSGAEAKTERIHKNKRGEQRELVDVHRNGGNKTKEYIHSGTMWKWHQRVDELWFHNTFVRPRAPNYTIVFGYVSISFRTQPQSPMTPKPLSLSTSTLSFFPSCKNQNKS